MPSSELGLSDVRAVSVTRRAVIGGLTGAVLASGGDPAYALDLAAFARHPVDRDSLWLRRPEGAEIMTRFRDDGDYRHDEVLKLSWFLRDRNDADTAVWIEPRLFDLVAGVQAAMSAVHGAPVPLVLLSGYRTPQHNARIETAARNSMHLYGYAADLAAPGYDPRAVALAASFYAQGGIGLYERFTHLDVWKVRVWAGPPARGAGGLPAAGVAAGKPS